MELRGHGYKFQKQHVGFDVKKFFFAIRLEIVELLAWIIWEKNSLLFEKLGAIKLYTT